MILQRFALDRWTRATYYLVAVTVGSACSGGPAPLVPEPLPPMERAQVAQWVDRFQPTRALRYDLRWLYVTQQGQSRGRAAVHFVPPDSARFDYRGPFGRSGAAVVIGDSVLWAQPGDDVGALVEAAKREVVERIHTETRRQLGLGVELDRVLFVGGGTVALAENIANWFPHQAIAEHPAFANARGMLKYLRYVCEASDAT